ncbi:lytic transglycosylase domain-containing protein [Thermomonas sp. HDW16]|uniref:lytic transglycosylase domain-containing protein n=1 Tax=Thermomonas sp. HDW16 TaxID=2714945 RepID=UPI001409613B|nr:lytic transglycosylase domain-containing protein [Thermomonas sp. HDW16]QIL21024.1 lytic transglycosylase domain-containing protein [Thermomonas sp. HDW16]
MKTMALACLVALLLAPAAASPAASPTLEAISAHFWNDLADPQCRKAPRRWRQHYGDIPRRLRSPREAQLRRHFAHVLDALDDAGLPSEFALIPFVESRYHPSARSPGGQVGLWQFTAVTARRNGLSVGKGRDQRLDAEASTGAAVRYLKRLHRMFGNDWRWTAMAYNAGEGAARAAKREGGPQHLSSITRHYPDKLHALACLIPRPPDPSHASG